MFVMLIMKKRVKGKKEEENSKVKIFFNKRQNPDFDDMKMGFENAGH